MPKSIALPTNASQRVADASSPSRLQPYATVETSTPVAPSDL